jgi:hypothetical protein
VGEIVDFEIGIETEDESVCEKREKGKRVCERDKREKGALAIGRQKKSQV